MKLILGSANFGTSYGISNTLKKISSNIDGLPILVNDTNDVIEFNSGFRNNNSKIKRNFWNLFKKND